MAHRVSSYSFSIKDDQRTFHHRWHVSEGEIYDCESCCSTRPVSDSYRQHWSSTTQSISEQHTALLQKIDDVKIQRFILCQGRKSKQQQQRDLSSKHGFLLEAGEREIPDFLRFMYHGVDELTVKLGLFVSVSDMESRLNNERPRELLFRSSELKLQTHYDITSSSDFLLTMLLEHIMRHLHKHCGEGAIFDVKRVELLVQRRKWSEAERQRASEEALPLQFSVKQGAGLKRATSSNDTSAAASKSAPGAANYYGLQRCSTSGELFAVPYSLQPSSLSNFVVTTDISGGACSVVPIRNLRRFMRPEAADTVLTCPRCDERFMEQTQLALHERLRCGQQFEIIEMAEDRVELYEDCLPLQCDALDWPIYGIPKQKKQNRSQK